MNMQEIKGGVTAPQGYKAAGMEAGIKKSGKDMAMLFSVVPCNVAGTFTSNLVKASPVMWDMKIVHEEKKAQAAVINSGVANACTGKEGMDRCYLMAEKAGECLNIAPSLVTVASTGVIGRQLPMDKICSGIEGLSGLLDDSIDAGTLAAEAIMTTDTVSKEAAVQIEIGGKNVTVGGMSKGSGMIHPNMCTMLSFVTTDACISQPLLQEILSESVRKSYNMISVDGDTSTNDTCLLFANGLAGNEEITEKNDDYAALKAAVDHVNITLAKKMAADGEGATALFEVKVIHAASKEQAVTLSKSVISSSLVKTAIAGHDANWGRIVCAMGYSGAAFDPETVDLYFESAAGKLKIIENGTDTGYSEETATKILSENHITAWIDLKEGVEEATAWGCDLTHEYISINADYRS